MGEIWRSSPAKTNSEKMLLGWDGWEGYTFVQLSAPIRML